MASALVPDAVVKSRSREIGSLDYRFEIWQAHRQHCC